MEETIWSWELVKETLGFLPSECKVVIKFDDGEEHHYPLTTNDDEYAWDGLERRDLSAFWELDKTFPIDSATPLDYNHILGGWVEGIFQSDYCPLRVYREPFTVVLTKRT